MDNFVLWRMEVMVSHKASGAICKLFEQTCVAVSLFETSEKNKKWKIVGFANAEPDRVVLERSISQVCLGLGEVSLSDLLCELVPPRDWLKENIKNFQPTEVGRFFIHGSHFDGKIPPGRVPILLDPGTAFGSGEHASTAGCLQMIAKLSKAHRFSRLLDMGCGSGILSIAMIKTWLVPVVAADVDAEAVRVTASNGRRNGVARLIFCICSRGY